MDPDLLYPEWSIGTYLALIMFITIILLNIIGSILSLMAEKKKKEYEENLKQEMKNKIG